MTRTNIVDNAYGVLNLAGDNTADAANPLKAENNWWGLCSPVGTNRCNGEPPGNTQPPNNGPAVSPTTNPGYPENPVNGAADATTGSTRSTSCPTATARRATRTPASSRSSRRRSRSPTPRRPSRPPRSADLPPRRHRPADRDAER